MIFIRHSVSLQKFLPTEVRYLRGEGIPSLLLGFMCIGILMLKEIKDEMSIKVHALNAENYWVRIISISLFIAFIILTASFNGGAFIYFQF